MVVYHWDATFSLICVDVIGVAGTESGVVGADADGACSVWVADMAMRTPGASPVWAFRGCGFDWLRVRVSPRQASRS